MNQKLLEKLMGFTFILLGIFVFLQIFTFFVKGMAFFVMIIMVIGPILGILAFVTGLLMYMDSKSE